MHAAWKFLRSISAALAFVVLSCTIAVQAFAQETTGGLEGVVKDPQGAVIANATVQLTGDKLIGVKTIRTDGSGYYRFTNVPPGSYTLTTIAPGFSELKRENVVVEVGHIPSINLGLSMGSEKTIVEVTSESPLIDVTQTRTQTNITQEQIAFEPHGTSFQSVVQFAPGARLEPLQGTNGFQINGGAGNENGYLIDGMISNSLVNGSTQANVPFEFLQEVQVKTTGIEAENPGGLGGIVNAIPNRGSNAWHGQLFGYYDADPLDASSSPSLRFNPQQAISNQPTRTDIPYQFYNPVKDHYRQIQPGITTGGFLVKDRVWAFVGLAPQYNSLRRTVTFVAPYGVRTLDQDSQRYYTTARLDGRVTEKIRVFGSFLYQYYRAAGTSLPNQDSVQGLYNSSSTTSPDNFQHGIGNVQPNFLATTGADITINSSLVATTKYGYFYQNYQDRGLPVGVRYLFGATGTGAKAIDGSVIGTTGGTSQLAQSSGFQTLPSNSQYLANQSISHQFNQDVAYFKKGFGGTHNLKFGYQLNHLYNNVVNSYNTGLVYIYPGTTYGPLASNQPNCAAIEATNLTRYGAVDNKGNTTINAAKCMGNYGYAYAREYGTIGAAGSFNHGFYAQDQWTVAHGLTLNLGLRVEKETLPAYDSYPSGIDFSWGDKIAPRLGAAWDVLQNGKLKVFGSYGVFNDVMKLGLAIDSFGGAYWHNCFYALDTPDYTTLNPVRDSSGHYCGGTGNANFVGSGKTPPSNLRFIENQNYRIPANDPSQGSSVAPGLKPYRQHQTTFGTNYQISRMWVVEATYDRQRLDHAIEDAGTITPAGETFLIVNPGQGVDLQPVANCATCKNQPAAARNYDALEVRFTKVASVHWAGHFSYIYSRLRGNYSGLTSTDTSDGVGRLSPNDNRSFDEPFFQFTAHGTSFNGPLATDRPNTAKGDVFYHISYLKRHETSFGLFQQLYQGTPLSTYESIAQPGYGTYVEGRGKYLPVTTGAGGAINFGTPSTRRTPLFVQSDLSVTHSYKVSDTHEAWRLGFEADILNALNTKHATIFNTRLDTGNLSAYVNPPGSTDANGNLQYGVLESPYDYQGLTNSQGLTLNGQYGQPTGFQTGRTIRLKGKFTF